MKITSLCIATVLSLSAIVLAAGADFSVKTYKPTPASLAIETVLDTTDAYADQLIAARDYRDKYPNDMGVQLRVSGFLAMDNLDSARMFYLDRARNEPENEIPQYLAGRMLQSPDEQRTYAEKMLAKNPNSYWGNLLLASSYSPASDPGFTQAEAALRKAIAVDNSLPFAVERLGHMFRARGETQAADDVYRKLGEMEPDRFEPVQFRGMLVASDQQKQIQLVNEFLSKHPDHVAALYARARAQRELKDWSGHIATMQHIVSVSRTGDHVYDLACGFSLAGQKDSAFTWLFTAADLGFTDMDQYKSDDDLIPLRDDARWTELLNKVQLAEQTRTAAYLQQLAATAPQRKQEAVGERLGAPAPDFSLDDLDGKKVSLADLRGKVVILDFWATWCGPCRKSMPILDKFYTDSRPKDVEIYGVNVWERNGTAGVKPFLTERNIHFPVLYGDAAMADAYGVRGIPTMVVIDKEGKVAYRHVGYNPALGEILGWQTKELLK